MFMTTRKKSVLTIVCIILALCMLTAFIAIFIPYYRENIARTTYVLPPKLTKALFDSSPDEFLFRYLPWYDECEDYRHHAYVDSSGNLVLKLTKNQENARLNMFGDRVTYAKSIGIDVSYDNTTVTCNFFAGDFSSSYPLLLNYELAFRQLFDGRDPSTIDVKLIIIDAGTHETAYEGYWLDGGIHIDFGELDLTPRPQN